MSSSKKSLDKSNPCNIPGMQCFQRGVGKICTSPATQTFQLLFSVCCLVSCSETCLTAMTEPLYVMLSQAFMLMAGFITEDNMNSFSIFMQDASDFTLIGYLERKWNEEINMWDRSFHDLSTEHLNDCNVPIIYKDGHYYQYNQDVIAEMVRGVRHVPYYGKLLNILTDKWNGMSNVLGLGHINTLHAHVIENNVTEEVARPRLSAMVSNVIDAFNECGGFAMFNQLLVEGVSIDCEITKSDDLEMYKCVSEEAKKMGLSDDKSTYCPNYPKKFPVFVKPVEGSNKDGYVIYNKDQFKSFMHRKDLFWSEFLTPLNQTCKVKENFSKGDYVHLSALNIDGIVESVTWKDEGGGFYEYEIRVNDSVNNKVNAKHENVECGYEKRRAMAIEANEKVTETLNAEKDGGSATTMSFNNLNVEKDGGSNAKANEKEKAVEQSNSTTTTTTTTTTINLNCNDETLNHASTFPIQNDCVVGPSDNEIEKAPDVSFMESYLNEKGRMTDADLDELYENRDKDDVDDDWYNLHPQYEWDEETDGPWKAKIIEETPKKAKSNLETFKSIWR